MSDSNEKQPDGKLLCFCNNVSYGEVRRVIREGHLKNATQVTKVCRAGGGCRSCLPEIEEVLEEIRSEGGGLLRRLFGRKS